MKQLFALFVFTSLFLTSCTNDESSLNDNSADQKMLESYVIKRNANGSYTLTHVVSEGVGTVYYDGDKLNEVQLYFDGKAVKTSYSRDYDVVNNELNINFVTENNSRQPRIQIVDDNTSAKGVYGLLDDYTVTENADKTVTINFVVDAGVSVEYTVNEAENINEIRLTSDSNATQSTFSKTYTRNSDGSLKIDFIQNGTTKEEADDYTKPRIIFIES